jgi:hypothetical protein
MRTDSGSIFGPHQHTRGSVASQPVARQWGVRRRVVTMLLPLSLAGTLSLALALPASAASHKSSGPKLHPLGTTFAFPDAKGTVVDVALAKVVTNAAPKGKKYAGLKGKGPVIGLEFTMKNISTVPADMSLFSTVLYYKSSVISLTRSLGATSLGSSLKLGGTLAPGAQRIGWSRCKARRRHSNACSQP